jgi:chemotaxis protein MotB
MATAAPKLKNAPEVRPIIVKKITVEAHGGHHGGAWKIAYADFVTAMMAFFLLMWLLGMTDEEKRKGLADYFTPTLIEYKQSSAGSTGILGGDSIVSENNYPHADGQMGDRALVVPRDVVGGPAELRPVAESEAQLAAVQRSIEQRIAKDAELRALAQQIRFTRTDEGLRIDLMDRADFSMFRLGTAQLLPQARRLVETVARSIARSPNRIIIRGHTDSRAYAPGGGMNNWLLSSARAESTLTVLQRAGIGGSRIERIEGVANRPTRPTGSTPATGGFRSRWRGKVCARRSAAVDRELHIAHRHARFEPDRHRLSRQ